MNIVSVVHEIFWTHKHIQSSLSFFIQNIWIFNNVKNSYAQWVTGLVNSCNTQKCKQTIESRTRREKSPPECRPAFLSSCPSALRYFTKSHFSYLPTILLRFFQASSKNPPAVVKAPMLLVFVQCRDPFFFKTYIHLQTPTSKCWKLKAAKPVKCSNLFNERHKKGVVEDDSQNLRWWK